MTQNFQRIFLQTQKFHFLAYAYNKTVSNSNLYIEDHNQSLFSVIKEAVYLENIVIGFVL